LQGCEACNLLSRPAPGADEGRCPRCGEVLDFRKPASLERTAAYVIAAAICYVPANLLPVLTTTTAVGAESDTIMQGVVLLWSPTGWPLSLIVLIASILIPVGKIAALGYLLVTVDQYVTPNTRFWQASGIDMSLSASGLSVQTQSILSILVGGVAFETPATGPVLSAAEADAEFTLFRDREEAFRLPTINPQTYVAVFKESVRGLTPGAPVEFKGIRIGEVTEVRGQFDANTFQFSVPVTVQVDPASLGVRFLGVSPEENVGAAHRRIIDAVVARGARAQLRSGSLLTGALFVAIDFFPSAPPASVDWSEDPARFPTVPGQIEAIEANVTSIIKKIDQMPIKDIGNDLRKALAGFDQTLASARGTLGRADSLVDNADRLIAPESILGAELGNTLEEVNRAARGLRGLADYLERHPEALLRGKPGKAQ
jgi:paraquat-inducible protein B